MHMNVIQRQYDEIIASHYDFDPQSVIGDSLDRAVRQIERHEAAGGHEPALRVLDLGVGTGRFLEKLRAYTGPRIQPFGLDISQNMIDIACQKIPDLVPAVDDAANLDAHFPELSFDLVSTHFLTGFVPLDLLAPKIAAKLVPGGLYSFVGGTKEGFPGLQNKAKSRLLRWLFGIKEVDIGELVCNPANQEEVASTLKRYGFTVRDCETFRPDVHFRDLQEFLEFAYYGGWLTPFVEGLGLHQAGARLRWILNTFVFPMQDHHSIVIALAQKN
jgi:SAM-dependent methyltransferase